MAGVGVLGRSGGGATIVIVLVLMAAGCGVKPFMPPAGPGAPAPSGGEAFAAATEACRDVRTFTAAMRLKGRLGDQRVPSVSLRGAATIDGGIRLVLSAAGRTRFIVSGRDGAATLWLSEGNRVVRASPDEIVDGLIGIAIGPRRLLNVLTGCVSNDRQFTSAERYGEDIRAHTSDAELFLSPRASAWQTIWGRFDALNVEYRRYDGVWPSEVRLTTDADRAPTVQLMFTIDERRLNDTLEPSAFDYQPPAGATPMSLAELRQAGPLGGSR